MVGDEARCAFIEVDVGGEVDAAAAAVGAVVFYGAVGDGGRAFQEQAAAAIHLRAVFFSEVVLDEASVHFHRFCRAAAVPAHGAAVVVRDVAVGERERHLVVAQGADGGVAVVDIRFGVDGKTS